LPVAPASKPSCSNRSYYCDSLGFVQRAFLKAVRKAGLKITSFRTWPQMRFLHYEYIGGCLPPHVDLSRTDPGSGVSSSHTFILYLSDCIKGGETVLLKSLGSNKLSNSIALASTATATSTTTTTTTATSTSLFDSSHTSYDNILYSVSPKKGRLLLFPHLCPHEGKATEVVPKLLLRGEVLM